jgi:tetratricopeptide (TPR) repeat protein
VQLAHGGCFFTGMQSELRDIPLQALRAFKAVDDGYHSVLGMAAFGLEECGDFVRAQALGEEAVGLEPGDAWAVHAVAHVHEMRGDLENGISWLANSFQHWAPENALAYHNWWHLALLHLDAGNIAEVLRLYDERIRAEQTDIVMEMLDASALLWRLHLEGADVAQRFAKLADAWERASEDAVYAFNDVHAVAAFMGAGRVNEARKTIAAMEGALLRDNDNAMMTRDVGLPLARAFVDFAEGRYAQSAEAIIAVRGIAQRFGGSHAQRDVLSLTALHAAIRGGMTETAKALVAERLKQKPHSPWALRLKAKTAPSKQQAA